MIPYAECLTRVTTASSDFNTISSPSNRNASSSDARTENAPNNAVPRGMYVLNRRDEAEPVSFDQILNRLTKLSYGLSPLVDPTRVAQNVINGMYSGIRTSELDDLAAQTSAYMAAHHPDFSKLAARIAIDNLHKNTSNDFGEVALILYSYLDKQGRQAPLISKEVYEFITEHRDVLNDSLQYEKDFDYDYFAFKTLERSYLLRHENRVIERPQHLLMRVACGIHCGDLPKVLETYYMLSNKYFIQATPTLFNAGTPRPQMSSCFLLTMKEDSIDGIFSTLKQCAMISKTAGGLGLAVSDIRATNSYIRGTNGYSNGLVPMLRVFNDASRYVDQGGGKRKGSIAIYLEPWHFDIIDFLDLKKNHGKEERRARDLFPALWIPDLFMERVYRNGNWTLMCPNECPGLTECWGNEFRTLYEKYENEGKGRQTIPAQSLWFAILQAQIETGTPYMVYKDSCNKKSNQQNLGTIKCSNLCTEIVQFTSPEEVAVCNLASLSLPKYVDAEKKEFDFKKLIAVTKVVARNLNKIIDRNYYPVIEAYNSNVKHRPIGIGVQGLADVFLLLRLPFESEKARELNKQIFEAIYYGACEASCELAEQEGSYASFQGSPASKGKLQFDLWNVNPSGVGGLCDWGILKQKIAKYGLRNSLLVAPMPTASTSQILGNNEAFEPYTSNLYCRRVLSGEFFVVNPHLMRDLISRGLWSDRARQELIAHNGSVQNMELIPEDLKVLYKTVWEIKQRVIVDMAVDRAPFIDQSQSLNIHMVNPTFAKLSTMHFHAWKCGLKTGIYYLRTKAAADAIKFTIDTDVKKAAQKRIEMQRESAQEKENINGLSNNSEIIEPVCQLKKKGTPDDEPCMMCSA